MGSSLTVSRYSVILLGAIGVGKGTQAKKLVEALKIPHISTGDILRAEVIAGSELGLKAKAVIDRGELVSDDLLIDIVRARLDKQDCARGAIFDGFPRTIPQADALESLLNEQDLPQPVVVSIDVPDDQIIARLMSRRVCATCGATFNLDLDQAAITSHKCPDGKAPNIILREDDKPETVQKRLEVYREKTAPLLDYYRKKRSLKNISGIGATQEVFARVLLALDSGLE